MITKDIKEYAEFLKDKKYRDPVERFVYRCGVHPDIEGYELLIDAVMLYNTRELKSFQEIFEVISQVHSKNFHTTKRAVNYAVSKTKTLSSYISKRIGVQLDYTIMPTGCAIAYIAKALYCNAFIYDVIKE